jgi:hypothetical protein
MNDEMKAEFAGLAEQIRKGFTANDRQFRLLKTRMAKLELELKGVQKSANANSIEISGLKAQKVHA